MKDIEAAYNSLSYSWRSPSKAPPYVDVLIVLGKTYAVAQRQGETGEPFFESIGGDFSGVVDGWMPLPPPPPKP